MFTLEGIKNTHAKVKSGADFPRYVQDMKTLGITRYDHYVADGHCIYWGEKEFNLSSPAKWESLPIASTPSAERLTEALRAHQGGQTDYLTFCRQAAKNGVKKWTVDMIAMTCTYYDLQGNDMLKEEIPTV